MERTVVLNPEETIRLMTSDDHSRSPLPLLVVPGWGFSASSRAWTKRLKP